jgi:tetratricopeptide (TPR) repeat protein
MRMNAEQWLRGSRRILDVLMAAFLMCQLASGADAKSEALLHYRRGSQAFVERRFDTTIDELNRSLTLDPKQLSAIRLLGLTYQLTNKLEEAELRFQEACRLAPKDAESWYYLGRVYYLQNFFDKGLSALETAVRYSPNDPRIRECLALTLEANGDTARAQREYDNAIRFVREKAGASATPYLSYGAFLLKLNRMDESERMLTRAAEALPGNWQAHFELGKLYHQTDRFEQALEQLQAALRCEPTADETRRTQGLLAAVYSRLNREEEARLAAAAAEP